MIPLWKSTTTTVLMISIASALEGLLLSISHKQYVEANLRRLEGHLKDGNDATPEDSPLCKELIEAMI